MTIIPDMIGLTVRDMGAALRFYRLLELAIPEGVDGELVVPGRSQGLGVGVQGQFHCSLQSINFSSLPAFASKRKIS